MLLCPHCWEKIKVVCDNCKRFVLVTWKKCPYCGMENEKMNGNREYAY
ncbi:MAG: hypothetical protein HXS54_13120 [Theionarchaea archaeon]|nr:hypothetical protein [Theionarchaea archaeon]